MYDTRVQAGRELAHALEDIGSEDMVVVAIPRGGVPVAVTAAEELSVPMVLVASRRIPHPKHEHMSIGAVTEDRTTVLNEPLVSRLRLEKDVIDEQADEVWQELQRQLKNCKGDRKLPDLSGKTVVIVDDGLISGYTMLAAVESVKKHSPREIVVAVPVAQQGALGLVEPQVDRVVCLRPQEKIPSKSLDAVYRNSPDITPEDIAISLEKASRF